MLKNAVLLNIFVETLILFFYLKKYLFEIENIINVFQVNFDQCNVSLLNKIIIL